MVNVMEAEMAADPTPRHRPSLAAGMASFAKGA